jgi:hypothetical protein
VRCQHRAAERLDFYLPNSLHPGQLAAKIKTANSRECRTKSHRARSVMNITARRPPRIFSPVLICIP